ncbi:MAG: hypothetical protein R6U10_07330 [Thermoplasmatota archaeon]
MKHKILAGTAAAIFLAAGVIGGLASAHTTTAMADDTTPPEVTILSPREGYIHFVGIELFQNPLGLTMTMGAFLLRPGRAVALDNVDHASELNVTVSLNGNPAVSAYFVPCDNTFEWQGSLGLGFGIYTLTVTAEDTSGNTGSASMQIFYDCILPASG